MMKVGLLVLLLLGSAVLIAGELSRLGREVRSGADPMPHRARFYRRLKGLLLLNLFFLTGVFGEDVIRWLALDWREAVLYGGMVLIILIWLFIVIARELRATAMEALQLKRALRKEAYSSIESEIKKAVEEQRRKKRQPSPPHS